jgi:flagellar hook-length control protein FliK
MLINTLFISKYQNTNHTEIKNNENQKLFAFLYSEIMNVENEKGIINLLPEHVGGNISEYKSVFVNYNFDSNVSLNLTSSSNDPIVNLSALFENELDVKSLNETEKIIYSPQQFISSFTELIKTILKSDKEISSVSLKLFSKNFIFNHSVDNSTLVDVEQLLKETFEKETIFSLSLSVSNKQVLFEILPQVESSSLNIRMNDSVKGNLSLPNYDGVLSSSIEMSSHDFANEESKNSNHRVTQENHNKLHEVSLHKLNPSLENTNDLIIEADSSLSNENKTEINTYLTHKESQSITKTYNNELSENQLTSNQLNTLVNKTPSIEPTIELSENKGISNYQKNSFNHNKNQQTSVKIFVSSFDTVSKNQSENDNKLNNITSNFENSELIEIAYRSSNSKITEDKIFYTKEDFLKNQLYNERQIQHIFRRIDSNSNYISKIISNNNAQSSKSPTINFDFQNDNFIVNKLSNENNSIIKDNSNNQLKNHSLSNSHNSETNKQIPSNSNYPQSKIDISKSAQILVNDEIISSEPLNKTHISKEFQVKETFEKTVNTKLIEHNNNTDKNSLTSSNSTVNFNENKSDKKIVDYKHSNKILFETNTDITKKTALSNTQNSTFQKNNHKENSNVSVNNQNHKQDIHNELNLQSFSERKIQSAPFKTEFEFSNNKPENNLGKNLSSLDNSLLKSLNNFAKTLSKLEYNIQAELSDSLLNDGSVELKLYPEELGKMRIFLESKENSISIRIEVQSEQVKNLILSNLTRLKDSFSFEGLNLQNLSVYFNTNEQKSQNGTNHKRKNYNTKLNTSIANNEEEIKIKNLGYNTIEYLA